MSSHHHILCHRVSPLLASQLASTYPQWRHSQSLDRVQNCGLKAKSPRNLHKEWGNDLADIPIGHKHIQVQALSKKTKTKKKKKKKKTKKTKKTKKIRRRRGKRRYAQVSLTASSSNENK